MEETLSRIVTDLEELHAPPTTSDLLQPPSVSESTLSDLHRLVEADESELLERFFEELASKNLPLSFLAQCIGSTMNSGSTPRLSLLASDVYLSLLLSPNAPVLSLFAPLSFASLLHSIRKSVKSRQAIPQKDSRSSASAPAKSKRKGGRRGPGSTNLCHIGTDYVEESEVDERLFFAVLEKLVLVMDLLHLDRFPDSLKSLVHTVAELPLMVPDSFGNSRSFCKLTDLCSQLLRALLRPEHGDQANSAAEVLKFLSPSILLAKSEVRMFALSFVINCMVDAGKECEGVKKAIVNLPKYLVQKAPEKSELRASAVESIMQIFRALQYSDQVNFVEYVVKMTEGKSSFRLLAVDLIVQIVLSLKDPLGVQANEVNDSWELRCLQALIKRCSDSNSAIRARALSNLVHLVGVYGNDDRSCKILKEVLGIGDGVSQKTEATINNLLKIRCTDEKGAARKAALHLVTKLTSFFSGPFDGVLLKAMGMACSDPLVSTRKAAVSALSEAFRKFPDGIVATEWLHSVPRLISDNESSIQEECENLFLELVLEKISRAGSAGSPHNCSAPYKSNGNEKDFDRQIDSLFPDGALGLLREICNGEVVPWIKKICKSLGKKNRLRPVLAAALQNIIRASESLWLSQSLPIDKWTAPQGAWFLLSEVSAFLPDAVDWEFLHHHWQLLDETRLGCERKTPFTHGDWHEDDDAEPYSITWAGDRVFLLQTMANISLELSPGPAADLAHNLLKRIEGFDMHPTEVNAHVKVLRTVCKQKALSAGEADTLILRWVRQLLSKATQAIEKYISENTQENEEGNFFTPPRSGNRRSGISMTSELLSQATIAAYTVGSLVIVCPSADLSTVIPLLHKIITSGDLQPKSKLLSAPQVSLKQIAVSLYIQGWLTMGKICLVDGKIAKRYIPLFVQELEKSDSATLRNNLVVMMADFCVRYTALIDCHIAKITRCLGDPCEIVRRQTFILLSRLLQRDYVKWRGQLFFRFLLSLVDESEKIRELADFLFGNILRVKAPLLAYNSFVEAIFALNDCRAHSGHCSSQSSQAESRLFSIRGIDEISRSKRMRIYTSLLKQMAPEHLLATFAKICAEILAAASDGMLSIEDTTGQSVLQILACKEIRLPTSRNSTLESPEMDEESNGSGGTSAAAAKGRAISQSVRKSLIQNTIPIFIELKRLLESKNSPLTGCLMDCLRLLLKDYKNEIDDILVADKQLQRELLYDMQKYESAKARSEAAEAVAAMEKSVNNHTPQASNAPSGVPCQKKSSNELRSNSRVASAGADAAAEATARSVLREVSRGTSTPPLSSLKVPKVRSCHGATGSGGAPSNRPKEVLESLRRQPFGSDDEN
ncbi:condensin-2 complex subunit D3 isoform X2 [Rhodamnia argentea]|uniref:Condensin-2 complex subunit D3 isoform X2 n=1 Tax=Rhodamnia argentea TaxID=178133 RepID=A0ABM3HB69_9MYRT|nr:condensin-2 complex subunit D3 isoform X2 [Rhodamnia argentea]